MWCSACSTENPPHAKFCLECGAPLARRCSACGTMLPDAARFCLECGQPVSGVAPPSPPTSPEAYTPRHLAEKILADRDTLAGERKHVTVLFADVVGSTDLIRDRDPEDAQRLLDGAVQRMMEAVHRYEGTVSRLMGDGLMAMFGAPVSHEDHAVRACYAALAMLESLRAYAEETRQVAGVDIQIRVGLNSGEVIVRLISDDLHMDYTAMGQTVHLASRMEGLAKAGAALISPATLGLVEGFVEVRPLGPTPVKGLEQPIDVYELVGAGMARTRLQEAAARGFAEFVGRQRELETIQTALDQAGGGRGQVVALVGEPGVGKSRLVYEATRAAGTAGWLVLQCGGLSYGKATSYLPIVDLLKSYYGIEPGDDAEAMRQRVMSRVSGLDPALEPILTPLLSLLDLPTGDKAWATLDPPRRRRATHDAVTHLLLRISEGQPLLLVVEDLHWVDSETHALLDGLVEGVPAAKIVLLVNYRPEYTHGWGNKSYYTQLRIDPLETASAEHLLRSLLGEDPALDPLKRHLIDRTGGNPLFLEETVRSLVETGMLVGRRGDYTLTGGVGEVRVPASVQVVLAARIDRLDPDEKRLLQTAAVIGKDVPFDLLQAVAEISADALHGLLSRLQSAELVYPIRLFPESEYTFKHALTHEVAYGSLLQERRKTLHARAVDVIERRYAGRLDEQAERLAHHAFRGQVWDRAVAYSREAGARAMGRSAVREGIAAFEQALAALEHLPESHARTEQAIDLRFELRTAYWSIGEHERAHDALRQAEALASDAEDRRRLGTVSVYLAQHLRGAVNHQQGVLVGERAITIASDLGDLALRVSAVDVTASSYHELGQLPRAIELIEASIPLLEGDLAHERWGQHSAPAVSSRAVLAWCYAWQGAFPEAIARAEEALRLADVIQHPHTTIDACQGGGLVYVIQGNVERAIQWLDRALSIRASLGERFGGLAAIAFAAPAYAMAGRVDEAIALEEQALEEAAIIGWRPCTSLWTCWLAGAYLRSGRLDDARRTAECAVAMGRDHQERGFEGYARHQLADVLMYEASPDVQRAEGLYRQALTIAEELGMRPLQAHCRLGLGKLYRRSGRLDAARAELSSAVSMLRDMGMTFWLPEAEAALAATAPTSID